MISSIHTPEKCSVVDVRLFLQTSSSGVSRGDGRCVADFGLTPSVQMSVSVLFLMLDTSYGKY